MYRTHKQHLGTITRGKTSPLRLRRLDRFLMFSEESLLRATDPSIFLDLGYGRLPTTTLESATRFRRWNPTLRVVGFEIDPERVAAAQFAVDAITDFRRGGFELPLRDDEPVRLLRAMNVLRQYPEHAVPEAHRQLRQKVTPHGLIVEGTSTPSGHRMAVNLFGPTRRSYLLFAVNLRHPLQRPWELTAILPKNYIHRMRPGEAVFSLFEDWEDAWRVTQPAEAFGPISHWVAAGEYLAARRTDVAAGDPWLRRGYLRWFSPEE